MKETVTLILIFLALLYQTVSADSNCTVIGCNSDFCVDNTCTNCNEPYFLSISLCRHCYLHCRTCDGKICYRCIDSACNYACKVADCPTSCSLLNNVACSRCPDGFYPYRHICYSCLHSGCQCTTPENCIGCLPGRYDTNSYCENTCPKECFTCANIHNCSKCVPGKYGPACASDCISACQDGSCDKYSGICFVGCPVDQYLGSDHMCMPCPNRCNSCTSINFCTSCRKTYYWGSECQYDCTGCYQNCNQNEGCMSGCDARYYREYDVERLGYECIRCPNHCLACNSTTECNACDTDYWGSYCQHSCTSCLTTCEKINGCTAGCLPGYHPQQISEGMQCEKCPDICLTCKNNSVCTDCKSGYYLLNGANCIACSNNCENGSCITYNGTCSKGCVTGWTGEKCKRKCPSGCVHCEQFSPSICTLCETGYYLANGTNCIACSNNCKNDRCITYNGTCNEGCVNGWTGHQCKQECPLGCVECQQSRPSVCILCKNGFYGNGCKNSCSDHCKQTVGAQVCQASDGACIHGCEIGYFGRTCASRCGKGCYGNLCNETSGTCLYGCIDNFIGSHCDKEFLCTNDNVKSETDQFAGTDGRSTNTATVVALSVVAGILVLLTSVTIAGVLVLFKRGKLVFIRNKDKTSSSESQNQELDNNAYQDLNRTEYADGTYSIVQTDYENSL